MKKFKILFAILAILLLMLIIISLPIFNVETVVVNGITEIDEMDILSKIYYKDKVNIFAVDSRKFEKEIEKLPYVKSASISKKLPNQIIVDIDERECIGYMLYSNDIYVYIDGEGIVLDMQNFTKENKPFFEGLGIAEVVKGEKLSVEDKEVYNIAITLANAFESYDFGDKIVRIKLDNTVDLIFYIDDVKVLFGNLDNVYKKMNWIDTIINNQLDENVSGTLDLRYVDKYPIFEEN
ncbi:MAG: cell division protein FtsQ/DivIB [Lachnospirales bacterium]